MLSIIAFSENSLLMRCEWQFTIALQTRSPESGRKLQKALQTRSPESGRKLQKTLQTRSPESGRKLQNSPDLGLTLTGS